MRKFNRSLTAIAAIVASCTLQNATAQWAANGTHIYNTNTGKVGIGIGATTPSGTLTVKGSGGVPSSVWTNAGAPLFVGLGENVVGNADYILGIASNLANARPVFIGRRSRGTLAAPTVVVNNDQLSSNLVSGFDGSAFQNPAAVDYFVDGVPSAGNVPARISFVTGSNGANRLERLKIGSNGDVTNTTGNLNMGSDLKTIQFALPTASSLPMMTMFPSGTQNYDRMVIAHSPSYPSWGLQYSDSLDKFNFLSGGTPVMTTDLGSWRVGIMNSSPAARLDIAGTGTYTLASSAGDFRLGDPTYNLKMGVANAGGGAGDAYISGSNRLYLGVSNNATNTGLMSLNSNATVGIGTFSPTARFQVVGDTFTVPVISATVNYSGNSQVRGIQSYSIPAAGYGYGIQSTGGLLGGYFIGSGGASTSTVYGAFCTANGSGAGDRMGVYGSASGATTGNENWGGYFPTKTYTTELRVGTTTGATGYKVSVNGKIIATEVRVEALANWPDYVFSANHKMLSIEELEASIKANKHLPGIPSAEEVKEGGIMLGAMQTKTMEKVEENTLYILQLNNKIKDLEKKIEDLTKMIK